MKNLNDMHTGKRARVVSLGGGAGAEQKLTDMGLIPGERISVINNTGIGPLTLSVKGSKLAIGHALAKKIIVKEI